MTGIAERRAMMPEAAGAILETRSLATAHRRLADLLQPGASVLDVGCGTGAITRGIAEIATVDGGLTIGVDINRHIIATARANQGSLSRLWFVTGDAYRLPLRRRFDIVAAARVLQWLADPNRALHEMINVMKDGATLVVLDYNHRKILWTPQPPKSIQVFYESFLSWREEAGMDNEIGDHLEAMFAKLKLRNIRVAPQHETTRRGDTDFETKCGLWGDVIAGRGHQLVRDGKMTERQRSTAESEYREWARSEAAAQTLYLVSVEGSR